MIWPLSLLPFFAPSQLPISIPSLTSTIQTGSLPLQWPAHDCNLTPPPPAWQIHTYNPDLLILRQSGCTDYEKPFLYLIFGEEKALLLDSGSRNGDVLPAVQEALRVRSWTGEVVVTHTHGHWDHVWGDAELREGGYTVIPATVDANAAYFGIVDQLGSVDLGGRTIDVIAIPGHEEASLAFYDGRSGILFSGDSVYPGRIYVPTTAWSAFVTSHKRLVDFTRNKTITHVLGAHIEQSRTPFQDYPVGTVFQPDEHALELGRAALVEIQDALDSLDGEGPERVDLREYTIVPVVRESGHNGSVSDALRLETLRAEL